MNFKIFFDTIMHSHYNKNCMVFKTSSCRLLSRLIRCKRSFSKIIKLNDKEFELPDGFTEPKYDVNSILKDSRVLLLRHANSKFNIPYDDCISKYGYKQEVLNLFLDDKYIDAPLTDFGIEQCLYASKIANQIEFDTVFVSPLKRAMQTAYYLLNSHQDFDKIKFVMHPGIREHIFGTGETSRNLKEQILNEYTKYFKNLDYSLLFRIDPITNKEEIDELFFCRDVHPELKTQIEESIIKRFPRSGEYLDGTYDRVQKVKRQLQLHIDKMPKEDSHKKILVVTHQVLIQFWTANWEGLSRPYPHLPQNFALVHNCEFYPDKAMFPI